MIPSPFAAEPADVSVEAGKALAQALASRICHDLVSPVGAVANGVDLVREVGAGEAVEEIAMIAESARRASDILAFHRLAFGAAAQDSPEIARAGLARTLAGAFDPRRVALEIEGLEGPALSRPAARAAALLCLCARGLLAGRGRVRLGLGADAPPLHALAEGAPPDRAGGALERLRGAPMPPPAPREVEFALLPLAAAEAGWRLAAETGAEGVRLSLSPA
jgi:histidine phosphotransferase ChpT